MERRAFIGIERTPQATAYGIPILAVFVGRIFVLSFVDGFDAQRQFRSWSVLVELFPLLHVLRVLHRVDHTAYTHICFSSLHISS